jgi:hypothetical protein
MKLLTHVTNAHMVATPVRIPLIALNANSVTICKSKSETTNGDHNHPLKNMHNGLDQYQLDNVLLTVTMASLEIELPTLVKNAQLAANTALLISSVTELYAHHVKYSLN